MKHAVPTSLCALLLASGCDLAVSQDLSTESARIAEWFEERYEEQLDFSPIQKTRMGRKDDYARLDDVSEQGLDGQLAWGRMAVADLRENFDYARLTPEMKISYDLWIYLHEQAEAAAKFRRRVYLFTQMPFASPHSALPRFLIGDHRVDDETDMSAYIDRLGEAARYIGQTLERAKLAASENVRAPRFTYETVLSESRAMVAGAPFDSSNAERQPTVSSPLWADASAKIDALVSADVIDRERAELLRSDVEQALISRLKPAYEALIAWVEAEIPLADEPATGVWKLPDGEAFYQERLAAYTTTNMSADEIHALGLSEVERINREMEAIKEQVGFTGTLREFFAFIREDPRFFLPSTDEGREAYLEISREHLSSMQERLPEFFGLLPKAELVVRRVEAFREQPGAPQHYMQGTPDGSRPGVYYTHLIDMSSMPIPDLEAVAYHEAIPGHHMQVSIAQELTDVPTFQTQGYLGAYSEGWGLYAEWLAKEMGGYADPYSDFGRLQAELWRAIRLVVDTGLHAKRWTEQEAIAYFTASSSVSAGQIQAEVRRYLVWPGQATGYKIGMLKIQELRARAETALGEEFDIRGFHDAVLGSGPLPLDILERRVEEWIATSQ